MKTKKTISTLVAILISLVFLWLAFKNIDFKQLMEMFKTINWFWTIPFCVVTWITFVWRALRWEVFLKPIRTVPMRECFGPMMVGFAFNSIFPARAGEFARPLALTKQTKIPYTSGFSTVVLERVCDMLALLGLFALMPLLIDFEDGFSRHYSTVKHVEGSDLAVYLKAATIVMALGILIVGAVWYLRQRQRMEDAPYLNAERTRKLTIIAATVLALLTAAGYFLIYSHVDVEKTYTFGKEFNITPSLLNEIMGKVSFFVLFLIAGSVAMISKRVQDLFLKIVHWMPLIPSAIKHKIDALFRSFAVGFVALREPKLLVQIVFHTIGIWVGTAATFWIMSLGVPGIEMSLPISIVYLVITCVVITIPAAPGYWGLYEIGGLMGLVICQVVPDDASGYALAVGYTLLVHFMQWALVTVIGLYYAGKIHVSVSESEAAKELVE